MKMLAKLLLFLFLLIGFTTYNSSFKKVTIKLEKDNVGVIYLKVGNYLNNNGNCFGMKINKHGGKY
jgi:hypothetical protein